MALAAAGDFSNATDMADYLAAKGLPFREAHEVTAKLVAYCVVEKCTLESLDLALLKSHSPLFEDDLFEALKVENVVLRRRSHGGTSPDLVKGQMERARDALKESGTT
jgi:argininosuccinate lyase